LETNGLLISTTGRALEAGSAGQSVRVELNKVPNFGQNAFSSSSKMVRMGKVIGPNEVQLEL
jgi:flagella basal body P-ring formation protein FlgA